MKLIKISLFILIMAFLISCGQEEKVVHHKKKVKPKPIKINTAALEKQEKELKALFEKKYIPLQYEHKKNPFKSVIDIYKENLQSDMNNNPLEAAALDQIKLVGIMEAEFGNVGVVEVVGKTFYVKVGDKMGMNDGVIVEINNDMIKIRQMETDIFGNVRSELVELMLERKEDSL
jgi:type IV pilus assembly protein PilP